MRLFTGRNIKTVSYTHLDVYKRQILNHFIQDEDTYRQVAALFNASLKESLNNEEQKKAFSETIKKIKKSSLDAASRNAKDIGELQRIIKEQAAIQNLHISLD